MKAQEKFQSLCAIDRPGNPHRIGDYLYTMVPEPEKGKPFVVVTDMEGRLQDTLSFSAAYSRFKKAGLV